MERTLASWDVAMPERTATMATSGPRATLVMNYCDGGCETIQVPTAVARALKAHRGDLPEQGASRDDLLALLDELQRTCAKERLVSLLERRDHSSLELVRRLARDGYPRFAQEHAVEVGRRCGLVNDELFAERFARSKSLSGWGLRRIEHELERRGVDVCALAGWPDDYLDVEGEYERARDVAARKHVREPNACMKLARFLVGRGFAYDLAFRVASETLA